jgi:AraC-like DNA-binding protein
MTAPQAWLKPSLHPVYARLICAELRRRGFGEAEILQGTRLDWAELHSSNLFLSFEQVRRLIVRALQLSQCPWLGLVVGQSTQLSAHGAVGYAAMAANNVGQVLTLMQRFTDLRLRWAYFDVDTSQGLALVLHTTLSDPEVHAYLMGHLVAALVRLTETITGQDLRERIAIHWPFAEPRDQASVQAYLAYCPHSHFNAPHMRVEMPADLLQTPCIAPDPDAYRIALRDCERMLAQQQKGSVSTRVQQRLLACEGRYPTLAQMAELEHVSPRTLIRHLKDEGLSYQQLLDGVREELACWLLVHTPLSVEAIAERLGYEDTSNFSRTFRRWLGTTPRAFRGVGEDPPQAG